MHTINATARSSVSVPVASSKALRAIVGLPVRILLKMLNAAFEWQEVYRQRRALLALSDEMLKDIGISRSQADFEGSKSFWRN